MSANEVAFVEALVHQFQVLLGVFEQHLEEQRGEVFPHVLMGDVTRWLVGRFITSGSSDTLLRDILGFMEQAFDDDEEQVQELLAVSFLENLPRFGEQGFAIRSILGPSMQKELQRLGV